MHTGANPADKSCKYIGIDIAIAIAEAATTALTDAANPIGKDGRTLPTIVRGGFAHGKPRRKIIPVSSYRHGCFIGRSTDAMHPPTRFPSTETTQMCRNTTPCEAKAQKQGAIKPQGQSSTTRPRTQPHATSLEKWSDRIKLSWPACS
jgi:hypothetical protein